MFKYIKLAFKIALIYGPESLDLLESAKVKKKNEEMLRNSKRLQLCEEHNPAFKGLANYSKHNCDFCKLAKDYVQLANRHNIPDSDIGDKVLSANTYLKFN